MKEISRIRKKIDKIDQIILKNLLERLSIAREIAKVKKEKGIEIYKSSREEKIIKNLLKKTPQDDAKIIEGIFRNIISSCRNIQRTLNISFLGPKATFTHQASQLIFGKFCNYTPALSIADVFEDVETERADYGVVPVENSTEGMVSATLDIFINSPLKIINEVFLPITLCLISKEKDIQKIRKIYSHASAFGQCKSFLAEFFPNAQKIEAYSTAEAVKIASEEKNSAAIGSKFAAQLYNLIVLKQNIDDLSENYTRFFVLGRNLAQPSGEDKTSILFSLKDRPGALHDSLSPFKKRNINLTKIESRPSKRKPWEYFFFVDFFGHIKNKKIKDAIGELEKHCDTIKILGSYPVGKIL